MYQDYIDRILEEYEKKKLANELSDPLLLLTTAKLRDECLSVYKKRYNRRYDEKALQSFFGIIDEQEDMLRSIKRINVDKFRQPISLIRGEIKDTDIKNVELIAWLIDFQPRPFMLGKDYSKKVILEENKSSAQNIESSDVNGKGDKPVNEIKETDDENLNEWRSIEDGEEPVIKDPTPENPSKENQEKESKDTKIGIENDRKQDAPIVMDGDKEKKEITSLEIVVSMLAKVPKWLSVAVLLILLSSGTLLYMQVNNEKDSNVMGSSLNHNGESGFMYWNGEEYKQINYIPMLDTIVIRLDVNKLKGFKKITRLNTLTEKDIDKLWYHRVSNTEIECFTSHGYHPVEDDKPLKKLTKYMFYKYVYGKY